MRAVLQIAAALISIYAKVRLCVYVCMYVCTCMYVCMYVCMCMYVVYVYVCMYVCVFVYVCVYVCMYVCIGHTPTKTMLRQTKTERHQFGDRQNRINHMSS